MATSPKEKTALKSLEEELKCPLCLEIFTEPKKLPCDHILCKPCLQKLILRSTDRSLTCPECRYNSSLLQGLEVTSFPSAHRVNRLIDIYQQLKEHKEPQATLAEQQHVPLCPVHTSQPLALYCETCQKAVCRDCALTTCKSCKHSYGFIKDMEMSYIMIENTIAPSRSLQQGIKTALTNIAEINEKLQSQKQKDLAAINEAFRTYEIELEREKARIMSEIENQFLQQTSQNVAKSKDLGEKLRLLETNMELVEESMTSEAKVIPEVTLIASQTLQDMHQQFQTLSLEAAAVPDLHTKVRFIPDEPRKFSFYVGNGYRCHLDDYHMLQSLKLKQTFQMDILLIPEPMETKITSAFTSLFDESFTSIALTKISPNVYRFSILPQKRGRHTLAIQHLHSDGKPLSSFVYVDPREIPTLGKPKHFSIPDAARVQCYNNKVYVSSLKADITVLEHKKYSLTYGSSLVIAGKIPLHGVHDFFIWNEEIYFTQEDKVGKASIDGNIIATIGNHGSLHESFKNPGGIKMNTHREIFVCDTMNDRIQVLDTSLKLLRTIERNKHSQLKCPLDLDFDEDGNIYAVGNNNRVYVLTPLGEHMRHICGSGSNDLIRPDAARIHNGYIYITNYGRQCVSVFTLAGEFVTSFGEKDGLKPLDIDIDDDGYIYIISAQKTVYKY